MQGIDVMVGEGVALRVSQAMFNELQPGNLLVHETTKYKVVAKCYDLISKDDGAMTKVLKRYITAEKAND